MLYCTSQNSIYAVILLLTSYISFLDRISRISRISWCLSSVFNIHEDHHFHSDVIRKQRARVTCGQQPFCLRVWAIKFVNKVHWAVDEIWLKRWTRSRYSFPAVIRISVRKCVRKCVRSTMYSVRSSYINVLFNTSNVRASVFYRGSCVCDSPSPTLRSESQGYITMYEQCESARGRGLTNSSRILHQGQHMEM